jgi:rhamnosyltransferase
MSPLDPDQPYPLRLVGQPAHPALSVLVRCRNEMNALPEFWRALQRQTAIAQVEILVLDSGSTDGSLEYLLERRCSLYQIPPEHFNFGRSCNQLMHLARAPRALFLSAHVLLEKDTVFQEIVTLLDPQRSQACYLRQVPNSIFGFNAYEAAYLNRRFPAGTSLRHLTRPAAFSNAASALTKNAWLQNPFPEIHGSEDFQWAQEHLHRGGDLLYLPHLLALHSHNETPAQVYQRVRLNVVARGQTGSYGRSLFLFGGILVQTLRAGASLRQAWSFAKSHARAYL